MDSQEWARAEKLFVKAEACALRCGLPPEKSSLIKEQFELAKKKKESVAITRNDQLPINADSTI
jgi:hypothetical protein